MQELSHSHGHTLDPSTQDTPLFGAEVDLAPGEIMPLGVVTDSLDEAYVKPKKRGRVTFWIATGWMALVIFLAVFADWLPFVHSYSAGSVLDGKEPPSLSHWMGTDVNGRDIFSRWVYGARVSLTIGLAAIVFGLLIGGFLGLLAGYHRRRTDTLIVTVMDILLAFPALVLALMLVTFGQAPDGGDRHIVVGADPLHLEPVRSGGVRARHPVDPTADSNRASEHALVVESRVRDGVSSARSEEQTRHQSGDPPERDPADALVRADRPRGPDRRRGSTRLPRPVRATADPVVGVHDLRGKEPTADGAMVDRVAPRPLHVPHDPRDQHDR